MNALQAGLIITGTALLAACGQETATPPAAEAPAAAPPAAAAPAAPAPAAGTSGMQERIVAERGGFIPEGIEYDHANGRFLTGSLAEGTIFEIAGDGSMTAAVSDPALVSSVGIEVDEPRDRLLVANSDRAAFGGQSQGQAMLGVYNLTTGERLAMVNLGPLAGGGDGAFFANDVAVTAGGVAYVTDTMRNVIYEVDGNYEASLFHRFEPMEGLGLNGIVAHADGYLIVVANGGEGVLYKVPLDDPGAAAAVSLDQPVIGADGLDWTEEGALAVTSNSTSSVVLLESTDSWSSARTVATASFDGQATTGTRVEDEFYVVQPHFNDPEQPVILRAVF
jgi:hypothetical protein